ncbi:TPM domain-containing protein [Tianweitania sp. BSSL-BM11]|uniref:TPM domain-containing protein n=1 Tax=Tianweitania aestuarii TaxID=2814886 RepID=A0ABS5RYU1_9HYPH|nr:TPM domain-containing protein [Tianweitania aestuarii]MBS9721486.1 TPM domain-containing protein [Tianweitania aestuarii]
MKTVLAGAALAAATAFVSVAHAAGGPILWPTKQDKAVCDPIFASLEKKERGLMVAQADTAEKKTPAQSPAQDQKPDEAALATELSAMLQACSYDGKAIQVDPRSLTEGGELAGAEAVQTIMRFTGLPQNFRIMESDVPNAAAMIVLGPDGVPQRVIAYNKRFMEQVRDATQNNDWSPLSIMAHEIGHHLSGHTLIPGGSQPPIELEADKFSGFVLYKMGAALTDAQKAIETLIPEEDGPTHPGRAKRLSAVEEGWQDSCEQQEGDCKAGAAVANADTQSGQAEAEMAQAEPAPAQSAPTSPPQQPQTAMNGSATAPMPKIPGAGDIIMPDESRRIQQADAKRTVQIDHLPKLDAGATPGKFDRFIYDEVGIFSPTIRDRLSKLAYDFAAAANVEVVTIVAKDLQGRTADQYALEAMRQLRVGKLQVGNGAVLVVAPEARQTGVALGGGLLLLYDDVEPIRSYLQAYLDLVAGGAKPQVASYTLAEANYRIMRDTKDLEWAIRYHSLGEIQAASERMIRENSAPNAPYKPENTTSLKLLRLEGTLVSKTPAMDDPELGINEPKTRHVGPAMHVRTPDGRNAVLYVNKNVPALMPVALEENKRYSFVARDSILKSDVPQLDLVSYDLLEN